jgi:hypothetical protein
MKIEIQYASNIDRERLKQHVTKEFLDRFLGVNFDYISSITAQRVDAKPEIILFIKYAIDLACKATWINASIDEGFGTDIDDIEDTLLRKLAHDDESKEY